MSCGEAPNFSDVTAWLNTPHHEPLTIAGLRGKVVIIDFWTYSCINCQRTLPHVEAWYKRYAPYGLEIVGVHTPEFAFEHVVSNVKAQSKTLGVKYPIAVDDDYGTWHAYHNNYWPAEYLIDATGVVRHVDYGEGSYSLTESLIRKLLLQANPGIKLPPPTTVPNLTPTEETNPESYVGYDYGLTYFDSTTEPRSNVATSITSRSRSRSVPSRSQAYGTSTRRKQRRAGRPNWSSATWRRTCTWSWAAPAR